MVNVLARDIFLNALLVFMALVVILLLLVNPAKQADEPPPGALSVYAVWPEGPHDVDVWTLAPGEKGPVGFTHKTGLILSLLRDDLGTAHDTAPGNFEHVYSRGLPAGEYIVNLHAWKVETFPITVAVEVRISLPGDESRKIISTNVTLTTSRQEVTAVRFRLDAEGNVVPGSMHHVFQPLYGAPKP